MDETKAAILSQVISTVRDCALSYKNRTLIDWQSLDFSQAKDKGRKEIEIEEGIFLAHRIVSTRIKQAHPSWNSLTFGW